MGFIQTFKKEFALIFRRPGMMILLFIGPLFLTFFFGGVYTHDYVADIPIAILDEDNTSLSYTVKDAFSSNERFNLAYYPSSRQELNQLIESGKVHLGVWIPPNFSDNVTSYKGTELLLFMDGTNLVVANNAYAQANLISQTISTGIEMKLIEAKGVTPEQSENMALTYQIGERILYDSKLTYMNYLIVCFLAVFLQQLFMSGMGSCLILDKETILGKRLFSSVWATSFVVLIGLIPAGIGSFLVVKNLFHVPVVGDLKLVALMTVIFLLSLTGPALILSSFAKTKINYSKISFMLSLPTFVSSGCVWPVEQMPESLQTLVKLFWPLINYAKPVQEIIVKGRTYSSLINNIKELLIYGLVWFGIGLLVYSKTYSKENQLSPQSV